MRPKKVIILLGTDAQALSVLAYKLRVNSFRDVPVETIEQARHLATSSNFNLLLITESVSLKDANTLTDQVRAVTSNPILLLHEPWPLAEYDKYPIFHGTAVMPSNALTAGIIEQIHHMCKRRRGPQPGRLKPTEPRAIEQVAVCLA